jgi:hypothetical protein
VIDDSNKQFNGNFEKQFVISALVPNETLINRFPCLADDFTIAIVNDFTLVLISRFAFQLNCPKSSCPKNKNINRSREVAAF